MASTGLAGQEGALVARASGGDRDAMAELYDRYFDSVYDFVFRMMRDADEAADVVQDVFLKAISAIGSLRKGERFRSWLFSIAHNTTLNRIEKRKRIVRPCAGEEDEEEPRIYERIDPNRLADPQAALVDRETASLVWEAAAGLDRGQYALLDLHVRQGLDSAEIAQVMGVSKGNAYTMVSRLKSAVEESITAYLMARRGRKECPTLNDMLGDQTIGGLTPELRRAITRHISECPPCAENKKRLVSPVAIFGAFAAVPPPLGLKQRIFQNIFGPPGGPTGGGRQGSLPAPQGQPAGREALAERMARISRQVVQGLPRSRFALLLAGGAMGTGGVLIVGLLALFGAFSGDGETAVLGTLLTPTSTATATPTATATATPTPTVTAPASPQPGPQATGFPAIATTPSPVSGPPSGTPGPVSGSTPTGGGAVEPTPTPTPTPTATPTPTSTPTPMPTPTPTPTPTPSPAPTPTPTPTPDTTGPQISRLSAEPTDIWEENPPLCAGNPKETTVIAEVSDPSGIASVTVAWSVASVSGSEPMSLSDSTAWAVVGPFDQDTITTPGASALVTITVTATDTIGNQSTDQTTITLHDCSPTVTAALSISRLISRHNSQPRPFQA